jgi:CheY-like chemotaxis protein
MDCRLPDADGCQTAAAIRAREGDGDHIPILALSAAAAPEDRARCLQAGMVGFLSKPVSLTELEEALAACSGSPPPTHNSAS